MGYHQAKEMTITIVATILVALVALEHLYILWIEMFAWTTKGREVFKGVLPDELFSSSAPEAWLPTKAYIMASSLRG